MDLWFCPLVSLTLQVFNFVSIFIHATDLRQITVTCINSGVPWPKDQIKIHLFYVKKHRQ
jgi:hypothetical protein